MMICKFRAKLLECNSAKQRSKHPHIWNRKIGDRRCCITADYYYHDDKRYVVIVFDNPINISPTEEEILYFQQNSIPTGIQSLMLIEKQCFKNYIDCEPDTEFNPRIYDGDNSEVKVLCGVYGCSSVCCERSQCVLGSTSCCHFICKSHLIPSTDTECDEFLQMLRDMKIYLRKKMHSSDLYVYIRTSLWRFAMRSDTSLSRLQLLEIYGNPKEFSFTCPVCIASQSRLDGQGVTSSNGEVGVGSLNLLHSELEGDLRHVIDQHQNPTNDGDNGNNNSRTSSTGNSSKSTNNNNDSGDHRSSSRHESSSRGPSLAVHTNSSSSSGVNGRNMSDANRKSNDFTASTITSHRATATISNSHSNISSNNENSNKQEQVFSVGDKVEVLSGDSSDISGGEQECWVLGVVDHRYSCGTHFDVLLLGDGSVMTFVSIDDMRAVSGDASRGNASDRRDAPTHSSNRVANYSLQSTREMPSKPYVTEPPSPDALPSSLSSIKQQQSLHTGARVEIRYAKNNKWFSGTVFSVDRAARTCEVDIDFPAARDPVSVHWEDLIVLDETGDNSVFQVSAVADVFVSGSGRWECGAVIVRVRRDGTYDVTFADDSTVFRRVAKEKLRVVTPAQRNDGNAGGNALNDSERKQLYDQRSDRCQSPLPRHESPPNRDQHDQHATESQCYPADVDQWPYGGDVDYAGESGHTVHNTTSQRETIADNSDREDRNNHQFQYIQYQEENQFQQQSDINDNDITCLSPVEGLGSHLHDMSISELPNPQNSSGPFTSPAPARQSKHVLDQPAQCSVAGSGEHDRSVPVTKSQGDVDNSVSEFGGRARDHNIMGPFSCCTPERPSAAVGSSSRYHRHTQYSSQHSNPSSQLGQLAQPSPVLNGDYSAIKVVQPYSSGSTSSVRHEVNLYSIPYSQTQPAPRTSNVVSDNISNSGKSTSINSHSHSEQSQQRQQPQGHFNKNEARLSEYYRTRLMNIKSQVMASRDCSLDDIDQLLVGWSLVELMQVDADVLGALLDSKRESDATVLSVSELSGSESSKPHAEVADADLTCLESPQPKSQPSHQQRDNLDPKIGIVTPAETQQQELNDSMGCSLTVDAGDAECDESFEAFLSVQPPDYNTERIREVRDGVLKDGEFTKQEVNSALCDLSDFDVLLLTEPDLRRALSNERFRAEVDQKGKQVAQLQTPSNQQPSSKSVLSVTQLSATQSSDPGQQSQVLEMDGAADADLTCLEPSQPAADSGNHSKHVVSDEELEHSQSHIIDNNGAHDAVSQSDAECDQCLEVFLSLQPSHRARRIRDLRTQLLGRFSRQAIDNVLFNLDDIELVYINERRFIELLQQMTPLQITLQPASLKNDPQQEQMTRQQHDVKAAIAVGDLGEKQLQKATVAWSDQQLQQQEQQQPSRSNPGADRRYSVSKILKPSSKSGGATALSQQHQAYNSWEEDTQFAGESEAPLSFNALSMAMPVSPASSPYHSGPAGHETRSDRNKFDFYTHLGESDATSYSQSQGSEEWSQMTKYGLAELAEQRPQTLSLTMMSPSDHQPEAVERRASVHRVATLSQGSAEDFQAQSTTLDSFHNPLIHNEHDFTVIEPSQPSQLGSQRDSQSIQHHAQYSQHSRSYPTPQKHLSAFNLLTNIDQLSLQLLRNRVNVLFDCTAEEVHALYDDMSAEDLGGLARGQDDDMLFGLVLSRRDTVTGKGATNSGSTSGGSAVREKKLFERSEGVFDIAATRAVERQLATNTSAHTAGPFTSISGIQQQQQYQQPPEPLHTASRKYHTTDYLAASTASEATVTAEKSRLSSFVATSKAVIAVPTVGTLTVFCPELNEKISLNIRTLLYDKYRILRTFGEVKNILCAEIGLSKLFRLERLLDAQPAARNDDYADALALCVLDSEDFSTEVTDSTVVTDGDDSRHYSTLSAGCTIEIRRFGVAFVGGKFRLSSIAAAERFNESLQTKVAQLSQLYVGFRKIRGDGNCYYRAIVFGLLEFVIVSGHRHMLGRVIDCFESQYYEGEPELNRNHARMMRMLRSAQDGLVWATLNEMQADILSESTGLDDALIRACKGLVARRLVADQRAVYNEMSIRDAILSTYEDVTSVESFCEKYVLRMEVCAEGIHVNLGVLPSALGCHCSIVLLPRDRDSRIATIENKVAGEGEAAGSCLCTLHLLLRPGHYDLLYPVNKQSGNVAKPTTPVVKSRLTLDSVSPGAVIHARPLSVQRVRPSTVLTSPSHIRECSGEQQSTIGVMESATKPRARSAAPTRNSITSSASAARRENQTKNSSVSSDSPFSKQVGDVDGDVKSTPPRSLKRDNRTLSPPSRSKLTPLNPTASHNRHGNKVHTRAKDGEQQSAAEIAVEEQQVQSDQQPSAEEEQVMSVLSVSLATAQKLLKKSYTVELAVSRYLYMSERQQAKFCTEAEQYLE